MVDANKNGFISNDEYSQLYREFNTDEKLINTLFKRANTNEDGIDCSDIQESHVNYFLFG